MDQTTARQFPEDIRTFILSGDAYQIYRTIQYSADLALHELKKTEKQKDFDHSLGEEIRETIRESLGHARELQFDLNKVNNKIQRERRLNHPLRNLIPQNEDTEDNYEALFFEECLNILVDEWEDNSSELRIILEKLREEFNLATGFRIHLVGCWDDILICYQEILAEQIVSISHRLSEVAIVLQDHEAIQKVRDILEALDIQIPEPGEFTLPEGTLELKMLLNNGVEAIESASRQLHYFRLQQQELKTVQSELQETYKRVTLLKEVPKTRKEEQRPTQSTKRMVFHVPRRKQ